MTKHYLVQLWTETEMFEIQTVAVSERRAISNCKFRLRQRGVYVPRNAEAEARELLYLGEEGRPG